MKYSYLVVGALIIGALVGAYAVLVTPHAEAPVHGEQGGEISRLPIAPSIPGHDESEHGVSGGSASGVSPGSQGDDVLVDPPSVVIPPTKSDPYPPVACTMDAKMCPDGSAVGRVGPNCEFAPCPTGGTSSSAEHVCMPQEKQAMACTMQYQPVCGLVEVQCVTTPCDPVYQTFGNGCSACSQGNVISYTEGMCQL